MNMHAGNCIKYTVKEGDSVWRIAKAHRITPGELIKANPQLGEAGRDPARIFPEEKLIIPKGSEFSKRANLKTGVVECKCKAPTKTLTDILRDYQVKDDNVVTWTPKVSGVIPLSFMGERDLTETEGEMLDRLSIHRGLLGLNTFDNIRKQASSVAIDRYPSPQPGNIPSRVPGTRVKEWVGNDGHRDAFRHAYGNALLTQEFGEKWTQEFTTAHEALPGNPAAREAMDLYNNEVGRRIAAKNPYAPKGRLAGLVKQSVDCGELIVIDKNGDLTWSDQVPVHDHGLTGRVPKGGVMPVPEGKVYAE